MPNNHQKIHKIFSAPDVTIIGAGPAGIATAIQLKRYGIEPCLLEKNEIGGLLRNANLVENYPGFPDGISGLELVNLFKKHIRELSIKILFEGAKKLDLENGRFLVETEKRVLHSRTVVVASGTKPKKFIDFEISEEVEGRIFHEVYPLLGVKRKKIAILGASDAAFDYALNLGRNNEVVVLNRGKTVKSLPLLKRRAGISPRIAYCEDTTISGVMRDSQSGIVLECMGPKGNSKLRVHYLMFATGREPQLDFLSERLKENASDTEKKGVLHFIGDVRNGIFRQTAIAVGDGIMAAMKIYKRLREMDT